MEPGAFDATLEMHLLVVAGVQILLAEGLLLVVVFLLLPEVHHHVVDLLDHFVGAHLPVHEHIRNAIS